VCRPRRRRDGVPIQRIGAGRAKTSARRGCNNAFDRVAPGLSRAVEMTTFSVRVSLQRWVRKRFLSWHVCGNGSNPARFNPRASRIQGRAEIFALPILGMFAPPAFNVSFSVSWCINSNKPILRYSNPPKTQFSQRSATPPLHFFITPCFLTTGVSYWR
jgi:hypothetical protein